MFDIGWSEMLVVALVAVLVIGPDELPAIMRTLGRVARRLQYVKYAFSQQFDDFMREDDLNNIRKSVNFEERNFNEAEADEENLALEDAKSTGQNTTQNSPAVPVATVVKE